MDALRVRTHIEKFLAGRYVKPVDDFCLYQWLERCAHHGWDELGLNLLKFVNSGAFEKGYQDRIQYLSSELHKRPAVQKPRVTMLASSCQRQGKRRRPGEKTPQPSFRSVIIEVLKARGGRARVRDVAEMVERRMGSRFTEADLETTSSGSTVWYNTMCWERQSMITDGVLRDDSRHGMWELADN